VPWGDPSEYVHTVVGKALDLNEDEVGTRMDNQEAKTLLTKKLAEYRHLSHADLVAKIDDIDCFEISGPTGVEYQIEIQIFWDDKPDGDLRVIGGIDDGGWRAFMPVCEDFIVTSDGRFVGE